ncbi:DUF5362 family protein [Halothermothrix orenii]|uniref:DUF5362 domain-containing protein n=1 Tax=Halothermothrix orenii (strain H 168 / OCM 544 / DSM 9562) TaxID=373903 RepID=B8CX56_HALOH|nr:DUF5362 family protein [Halothermothrix orenii]ACL69875.1 hypothetical protein Hore_11230 [Halothermothrix orenii H 168]
MRREQLQELSKWTGFVGIVTIIFGVIATIFGLFQFVIGAIPGIVTIVVGVKLRNAKKAADRMLRPGGEENPEADTYDLFENLNSYFKIQGILLIIYLVLLGISIIAGIALMGTVFSSF